MTVTFITVTDSVTNQTTEHAIIDRGNEEYTSMPKSVYDAQQANQNNPIGGVN